MLSQTPCSEGPSEGGTNRYGADVELAVVRQKSNHAMNNMFDSIAAHSDWLLSFAPILGLVVYLTVASWGEAYTRRRNYHELIVLNELREKSIITQEEFDGKKEELLNA